LLQIYRTIFDEACVISLKTNGEDIAVTNENRAEFVHLYVDYLLNRSIAPQFDALSRGFHKVTHLCLQFFTRTKRRVQLIDNSHAYSYHCSDNVSIERNKDNQAFKLYM
jgi:hypothetical protein